MLTKYRQKKDGGVEAPISLQGFFEDSDEEFFEQVSTVRDCLFTSRFI